MKKLQVRRVLIAGCITYVLGISVFLGSFFIPILSDPETQANIFLAVFIIPAAILGARYYYQKANQANGVRVGLTMFLIVMFLDATITVPLFVIPAGGNHIAFFSDPVFWLIGLEYILTVFIYWRLHKSKYTADLNQRLAIDSETGY